MDTLSSDPPLKKKMVKTTKSAIVWTLGKIFKNKKKSPRGILFYTFGPIYGPKFLIAYVCRSCTLLFSKNQHLTACQMAQRSDTQNSKIGHLEHPMAHLYADT